MSKWRRCIVGYCCLIVSAGSNALGTQATGNAVPSSGQLSAQTRSRESERASISGIVLLMGGGKPLKGVRVRLVGGEPRILLTATTDLQGKFVFGGLSPGRYAASASKPGYPDSTYGQGASGFVAGPPIQVSAGDQAVIQIQMSRGAVVTGALSDESNDPLSGILVRAYRAGTTNSRGELQVAGQIATSTTDDRGIYRVYGLPAGTYVVCANPSGSSDADGPSASEASGDPRRSSTGDSRDPLGQGGSGSYRPRRRIGYAPVCFPGSAVLGSARRIVLAPGQERAGLDFQLQLTPLLQINGTVTGLSSGGGTTQVRLVNTENPLPGIASVTAQTDAAGHFFFHSVVAGRYTVIAKTLVMPDTSAATVVGATESTKDGPFGMTQPVLLYGTADIALDDQDIDNVVVNLKPGVTVSGRVVFVGARRLRVPTDLTHVSVSLVPAAASANNTVATQVSATPDRNGDFVIGNVLPGMYHLSAITSGGWILASAVIGGQDTLDTPILVAPAQNLSGALVTYSDSQTECAGLVERSSGQKEIGAVVVIYSVDPRYWTPTSRRVATTLSATDGHFVFKGLPPGDYRLSVMPEGASATPLGPEVLQELERTALVVSLLEGEKKMPLVIRR